MFQISCIFNGSGDIWSRRFRVLHGALKLSNDILKASFTLCAETEQWHPEGKFYSGPKLSNDILKASFTVARNWAMTSWRQVLHGAPKLSNDILKSSFIRYSSPKLSNDILKASFTWRAKTEQWHPEVKFYTATDRCQSLSDLILHW